MPIFRAFDTVAKLKFSFIGFVLAVDSFASIASADAWAIERRKDQFPTTSGRLLAPLPYSMPGIGRGFFILGNFGNVFATTADITVLKATGDIQGSDVNINEVPVINKHLYLHTEFLDLSRVQQNYYQTRGMDTDKNDYSLLDISTYKNQQFGLDLTFYDRRLTFTVNRSIAKGELDTIRDPDGVVITEFTNPYTFSSYQTTWAVQLDLTDDYQDPRDGIRLNLRFQDEPADSSDDPDFYVTELDASWYLPMRAHDTLVLNFFQSDAHVRSQGNVDRTAIANELGFNCDPGDTQCLDTEAAVIDTFVDQRTNGTAAALGGFNRLRAYPGARFNGAHTSTIGGEYRMNFVRDATPFDYSIWKDTHTGIQVAFFSEIGTVAETTGDLWKQTRYVVGSGVRLVTESGAVYRFDLAKGNEGVQPNLFFYYPWN